MFLVNARRRKRKGKKRHHRRAKKNAFMSVVNRPKRRKRSHKRRKSRRNRVYVRARRVYVKNKRRGRRRHRRVARRNRSLARRIPSPLGLAKSAAAVLGGAVAPNFVENIIPFAPTTQFGMLAKKAVALVIPGLLAGFLGFNKKTVNFIWLGAGLNGLLSIAKMEGYSIPGFGAAMLSTNPVDMGMYPQSSLMESDQSMSMPVRLQNVLLQ